MGEIALYRKKGDQGEDLLCHRYGPDGVSSELATTCFESPTQPVTLKDIDDRFRLANGCYGLLDVYKYEWYGEPKLTIYGDRQAYLNVGSSTHSSEKIKQIRQGWIEYYKKVLFELESQVIGPNGQYKFGQDHPYIQLYRRSASVLQALATVRIAIGPLAEISQDIQNSAMKDPNLIGALYIPEKGIMLIPSNSQLFPSPTYPLTKEAMEQQFPSLIHELSHAVDWGLVQSDDIDLWYDPQWRLVNENNSACHPKNPSSSLYKRFDQAKKVIAVSFIEQPGQVKTLNYDHRIGRYFMYPIRPGKEKACKPDRYFENSLLFEMDAFLQQAAITLFLKHFSVEEIARYQKEMSNPEVQKEFFNRIHNFSLQDGGTIALFFGVGSNYFESKGYEGPNNFYEFLHPTYRQLQFDEGKCYPSDLK